MIVVLNITLAAALLETFAALEFPADKKNVE
jgi:hypothetical protein